ncbi:MAG: mechanosensitive ion channel [Leptolyngbyaceae cyanobacterium SU_3_3]|nr:mechanosensitive ion channel [Leptolyngbyaceae cyanobacterium SU_3_3]
MQLLFSFADLFNTPQAAPFKNGDSGITIGSIATLILSAIVTSILARLLRNWLRKRILYKMGLEEGSREAIAAIISYSAGAIGFVVILQTAGVNLNSLTFLAGGLGIGLGFGLQELAKNFISGVTLLFEQPIKVGDFVEVDGLTGTVQKISIRSTMIQTNDGVSVIIPNLNFVINKIVNWSHQDPKCRLRISIGVAEDTDLVLVTELLLTTAYMESRVLSVPAPEVWLQDFQDGTVNLDLLVWINQPKFKDPIASALRFAIQYEFRQRGIRLFGTAQSLSLRSVDLPSPISSPGSFSTAPSFDEMDTTLIETRLNEPIPYRPQQSPLSQLLRQVSYFENFTDLNLLQLIQQGYRQTFDANTIIFHENEPGDSFYIILSGAIEVFSERPNKHLTILYAGDFFGELSLLMGIRRTATIRTLENTVLFVVSQSGMQKLLASHRGLADSIAQKLAERQQELTQRQQLLKELNLLGEVDLEQNPIVWIRKRLRLWFEL